MASQTNSQKAVFISPRVEDYRLCIFNADLWQAYNVAVQRPSGAVKEDDLLENTWKPEPLCRRLILNTCCIKMQILAGGGITKNAGFLRLFDGLKLVHV